jgi:hypothetical protein
MRGERAFEYTVWAFGVAVFFPLAFAAVVPLSPLLLVILGVPVGFVGVVWFLLHRKCSRGGVWPGRIAWMLIVLFACSCFFLVSFGGFQWIPACWLLGLAAANTPLPDRGPGGLG